MAFESDVFTRQQIYLEAVKNDQAAQFDETMRDVIIAVVVSLVSRAGYDNIGQMPKSKLRILLGQINTRLSVKFADFKAVTIKQLQDIMGADLAVTTELFRTFNVPGVYVKTRIDLSAASPNRKAMWAKLTNDIVPGPGVAPGELIGSYFGSVTKDVLALVRNAYADNLTAKDILTRLVGTRNNRFKDGLLNRFRNQYGAMTDTLIQHITSAVSQTIGKVFSDNYEWISVLDSGTTDICRSRNGNVYEYGHGPQPPAHYRCRSRTRPVFVTETAPVPPTFYAWLKDQPTIIQNDAVGQRAAAGLRAGTLGAKDFPKFTSSKRLTPEQYAGKRSMMLTKQ